MRILLVEDERGIADFVERALRGQGHDVEVATDGPAGERRALESDPDLVILDVMLPVEAVGRLMKCHDSVREYPAMSRSSIRQSELRLEIRRRP